MPLTITPEFRTAAVAYLAGKNKVQRHYWRLLHGLEPLPDAEFFPVLDLFRVEVAYFVKRGDSRMVAVKNAATEFFRKAVVGDYEFDYETALRFYVTYKKLKNRVGRAIGDLFDYHGDGFGDLVDALPLGGKALVERALATDTKRPNRAGFLTEKELYDAFKDVEEPFKALMDHELYVASSLEDGGLEYLWSYMRHNVFDHEDGRVIESMAD